MTLQGCLEICWNCCIIQLFINAFQLIISIRRVGTYILTINIYIYIFIYKKPVVLVIFIYGIEI